MSSASSTPTDLRSGRDRKPVLLVVVTLAAMAVLVWALNPRQPSLRPAPLGAPLPSCARLPREFVPTDVTDLVEPPFPTLPHDEKLRALARMNTEECTCGCKLSVAACRLNDPTCKTSAARTKEIVAAAGR